MYRISVEGGGGGGGGCAPHAPPLDPALDAAGKGPGVS